MKLNSLPLLPLAAFAAFAAHAETISIPSVAAAKRPITHEDIWLAKRLAGPVLSPDGRWAAVRVTAPDYDEKKQTQDIWLVATDGRTPPRQLTFNPSAETGLAWSPDGTRLAFSSKREGDDAAQIYVIDLAAGGEARRVTSFSGGAREPRWSPDGTRLLFLSNAYADATDDAAQQKLVAAKKAQKAKVRVYDGFPVRNWDKWLDEQQTRVFAQDIAYGSVARDLLAGTALVKNPGFGGRYSPTGEEFDAAWAPDGQAVIFAATTERDRAAYAQFAVHLYTVPVTGGEPRVLTTGARVYGRPEFTPDGKFLLATVTENDGQLFNNTRLAALDWPSVGEPRVFTAALDVSAREYAPGPDGDTVYFTAEDQGLTRIFFASISGRNSPGAFPQAAGTYTAVGAAGTPGNPVVVGIYEDGVTPPDLRRVNAPAGTPAELTRFNATQLAAADVRPVESFWFTAKNGRRIHNLVVLPPAYDPAKKYPLVTLIHGGPHTMSGDTFGLRWNPHLLAAGGYLVLQTNYTGSTGFGEAFAQAIKGDPLRGPADELLEAIDEAAKRYPAVDLGRLAAGGPSYGGFLTNWLLGQSDRFRALFSHAGMANLESLWGSTDIIYRGERSFGGPPWELNPVWREQSPHLAAAKFKTPILLSVGEKDFRVPINNTLELWSILQRQRVPGRLLVYPDENHWILNGENHRHQLGEVAAWLKRWL